MVQGAAVAEPVSLETVRLLWAASRPDPDADAIRAELHNGADVDAAAHTALVNRVGSLFWRALAVAGVQDRVGPRRALLEQEADLRRAQSVVLLPLALDRIVHPLRDVGLQPLIFKGPAVAARYPEPGLRSMDDIDVILPPGSHRAGVDALTRAGWTDVRHQRTAAPRRRDNYDTVLVHPDVPHLPLELHWDVASWHERATSVRAADLWQSRQPLSLFGTDAFGLPPEEELVALANHAGKPFHHFSRLVWSVDLAVVIDTAPEGVDWDRVASLARRWSCRTVLGVGLVHARRLGAEVPDALIALPSRQARRNRILPVLEESWPFVVPDEQMVYQLRYAFSDARARQAQLVLGELVFGAPTGAIPGRALRLIRQIATRARRVKRSVPDDPSG